MNFRLAGLLRVRGAQERVAADDLSRARDERAQVEAAERRLIASISDISDAIGDGSSLLAMAAARAAGNSALSDLRTLAEMRRSEEALAKSAHVDARRDLKGLERLEERHQRETAKAELDAEQTALDEMAGARTIRQEGSAA